MPENEKIERIRREAEGAEYRCVSESLKLGLEAAALAAPLVQPVYSAAKDKLTKDARTPVVIPPGTVKPDKE